MFTCLVRLALAAAASLSRSFTAIADLCLSTAAYTHAKHSQQKQVDVLAKKVRNTTGTKGRAKQIELEYQPQTVSANLPAVDIDLNRSFMHACMLIEKLLIDKPMHQLIDWQNGCLTSHCVVASRRQGCKTYCHQSYIKKQGFNILT